MTASSAVSSLVRCALAFGFGALCLAQARRLGWAGAFLMTAIAGLDVATVLGWALLNMSGAASQGAYTARSVFNVLFNLASLAMVVVALVLWRKAPFA